MMKTLRVFCICAAAVAVLLSSAYAQNYPNRPIHFIVPYPPGGGTDLVSRILGQKMTEAWGEQVIIENRPGAQGNIGQARAAKARPDGYTIVLGATAALCINPLLYKNVGFDTARDFAPVALATRQPYFIVVHPSVPARTIKELIALGKANPNRLNFGTSGGLPQFGGELFKSMAGFNMTHIPYSGAGPALIGLMAGQLDVSISTPAGPMPFVRSGRVRLLAVTSDKRIDLVPDTPTVAESGVPGYEMTGWYAVLAPAGTPKEIINKLNAEIVRTLLLPETKERLAQDAVQPAGGTPEEFAAYLGKELEKWAKVIKNSGIKQLD